MLSDRETLSRRLSVKTLLGVMVALQVMWLGAKIAITYSGSPSDGIIANPKNNPFEARGLVLAFMGVGTILIFVCPESIFRRLDGFMQDVCRRPYNAAALLSSLTVGVTIIPVLTFPFGGDEKALYDAGSILANEGWVSFLRQYPQTPGVGDRHPMFVPLLAGVGQLLFGNSPFGTRFLFLGFLAGSTVLTYLIGRRLYDEMTGVQAAVAFLTLRLILFMGIRVSTDLPVTFFALLAIFFALQLREGPTIGRTIQTGGAVGLGLFSKYTLGMILPFLGYILLRDRQRTAWPYIAGAGVLLVAVLGGFVGLLYSTGALEDQIRTVGSHLGWTEGLNLFSSWRMQFRLKAILIQLPSALGAYFLPILALGGWKAIRRWTTKERLLAVWIGAVFLFLLITLPVDRYFLPAFPALAIVGAVGLRLVGENAWRLLLLSLLYSVGTALLYT